MNIDYSKLNTQVRRDKAGLITEEMEEVINNEKFKTIFLHLLHSSPYDEKAELSKYKNHTPEYIYSVIMKAAEVLNPEENYIMDLKVDDYYTFKNVIGHTYKSDPYIYTNTKYFDKWNTKKIGANFFHEWGHKLGFSHAFRNTKNRKYSLCYLMGKAYQMAWNEIYDKDTAHPSDKKLVCRRTWIFFKKCRWVNA